MTTKKSGGLSIKARDNLAGYLFIAPSLIGFCVFTPSPYPLPTGAC